MDTIERFATALDVDDYATASACMEPDAVYDDAGAKTIVGRDAILDSFRSASEWGKSRLDKLEFRHEIDDAALAIRFIDILTYRGEELIVDHTMRVTLSERGLLSGLRLVYPPGERERVSHFFERHGLQR